MWGWDRKICPEDHKLASQDLSSDDTGDPEGKIFLSYRHMFNGFFFLHTIKYGIFYIKKGLPGGPEYAGMQHIT